MDERCPNCGANLSRQLFIGFGSGFGGWHHGWGGYGWHRSDEE